LTELEPANRYETMQKIVDAYVRGAKPSDIARELGVRRQDVDEHLSEWRDIIINDKFVQERAKESLANADAHYNQLIAQAWEVVEQADSEPDNPKYMAQKLTSIKLIGDLEAKRFTMLKEMGLLDNASLAAEIAERERKEEIMVSILREVICDHCKPEVIRRISEITGRMEPVEIIRHD
jgi:hypothetical protein